MRDDGTDLEHRYADANGIRLHYVEAGTGPLVLLLHGFPEYWRGWHRQIPMLAEAGFRVVAPDMRGYNLSDKPRGWRSFGREQLAGDIYALIRALGVEKAHLVGHDWGGTVAWYTAIDHPRSVDRLVVLDAAHPRQFAMGFRLLKQLRRSWYVFSFQLPWLPEIAVRAGSWRLLRDPLENDARPGALDRDDIEQYVAAWSQPGATTAQINYYRAAIRRSRRLTSKKNNPPVEAPTMVIWGENDRYGLPELAFQDDEVVPNLERVEILPGASHWVQHDEPERVGQLLIDFLGQS